MNTDSLFRFGEETVIVFFLQCGFVIDFCFVKTRNKNAVNACLQVGDADLHTAADCHGAGLPDEMQW